MSPRRRLLAAAMGGLVAVLAVVVVVLLLTRDSALPGRTLGSGVPQDQPGPVLLVPGYGGGRDALDVLAERLRARGRDATVVRLPGEGTGDLRQAARALDTAARAAIAAGAPSVDVVGFSAGGVTARVWAQDMDGDKRARRIVTLGAPHHGTDLAALAQRFAPSSCPEACRQLVPDSGLLRAINDGDETPDGPLWESIWTRSDETVTPPDSARLAGAVDVAVQAVCPDATVDHGNLPRDPLVTELVLRALAVDEPTQPAAGDCTALRAAAR